MTIKQVTNLLELYKSDYGTPKQMKKGKRNNYQTGLWVDSFLEYHKIIQNEVREINPELEITPWIYLIEYRKGNYFKEHTDYYGNRNNKKEDLLYSGGYLLNKEFKGGEFILEDEVQTHNIGELFYFKRTERHEVKEITEGVRYSLHFGIIDRSLSSKKTLI